MLLTITFGTTYSIYSTSGYSTIDTNTAAWIVKVNGTDITSNNSFEISNISVDNTSSKAKTGTIAPGSRGTVDLIIDATGTEVSVDYIVTIGDPVVIINDEGSINSGQDSNETNNSIDLTDIFTITAASGSSLTGTIIQNDSSMTETIHLNFEWNKQNNNTVNSADIEAAGKSLLVPITVTTTQHVSQ